MHPVLIRFSDSFFIGTYGLLIAVGLLAGAALASWLGKRRGLNPEIFFDLVFIAVAAGFLGARLLYIITEFPEFLKNPGELIFSRTGFVFLGGFIGAAGACIFYIRRKRLDPWLIGDILMPALALAHGFGRIGCHFAGCCYGGECRVPLGIQVPRITMPDGGLWPNAYADQVATGKINGMIAAHSLPIWPVQLMEATGLFLLTGFLVWMIFRVFPRGVVLGTYLVLYAVLRFVLEYLRGDAERGLFFNGAISTSQILSIIMFAAGLVILFRRGRSNSP
ncbi:prolipoprotein diacylglyceryl transferase [Candidatus Sumerlaeota bacterium]|nr:prolipoprotein diacylglyceryl transferase [Candidatus Sumerlaeota bacterium]